MAKKISDDLVYLIKLYDIYSNLLTDKKKLCFEYYYFDDLSLAEISELLNISRQAVLDNLHQSEMKLIKYEKKLKIFEKNNKIITLINSFYSTNDKKLLNEIINLCN